MLGNIRMFLSFIATAVIFAIFLVTANTMAMTVRERSSEVAVLKTLGFRRRYTFRCWSGNRWRFRRVGGSVGRGRGATDPRQP